jgi:large subunit ribosomal protein L3
MNQHPGTIGKKIGMTQIFAEDGLVRRVTVVESKPVVLGLRTLEKDGYSAVIFGLGERKEKHTNKAQLGQAQKAGTTPKRVIRELRVAADVAAKYEIGKEVPLTDIFEEGQFVDVQGLTRGRGFTGVMRRWNFSGFPATHGTHEYRRHGGSIGTNMTPGRTLPNLKMGGQYGNETVSTLNLKIVKINVEDGLLLIDGAIPGSKNGTVVVRGAVKKKNGGKKKALFASSSGRPRRVDPPGSTRFSFPTSRGRGEASARSQGCEAALTKSRMAEVSRTPSRPNCNPRPSGLFQRTVAGMRITGSSSSSTTISVPNGYCFATPTNMPPILRSVARPLVRAPSGPSMITFKNTSFLENLRSSVNVLAPLR